MPPNDTPSSHRPISISARLPSSASMSEKMSIPEDPALHRSLKTRHITMISLGGTIGTGLFLASGASIAGAGPGGALVAYILIGVLVYFMMTSLGEMATFLPITGSFNSYGARFVDPAFGFALGWNYWYSWATTVAVELTAASLIMGFWFPTVSPILWSAITLIIIFGLNLISVKSYGEAEYWFSLIKVITIILFIIFGIFIAAGVIGGHTYGFDNWKTGETFHGGFVGCLSVFLAAGFSFQGTELVGVTAGESENPRKDVPKAITQTFWRILLFYIFSIFITGLIVPWNDPKLLASGSDGSVSPFTIVFTNAGLAAASHIMNVIILITVLSAGNSGMYAASRTLYILAQENKAPKFLTKVSKNGVPVYALLATAIVGSLAFTTSLFGNGVVYMWLLSMAGVSGFIAWLGIAISHYRFRKAFIRQGHSLDELPYRALLFPIGPILATILIVFIVGLQGYAVVATSTGDINPETIVAAYIGIPLFLIFYLTYKIWNKTKFVSLDTMDLDTGRLIHLEQDYEKRGIHLNQQDQGTGLWARIKRNKVVQMLDNV